MGNQLIRVTVVDKIYHQIPGEDPTHVTTGFTRHLRLDEQPFIRKSRKLASETFEPLPSLGWLDDKPVSFVCLKNESKMVSEVYVDPEVDPIIYYTLAGANSAFSLCPGEGVRLAPTQPKDIMIRGINGARYSLTALPD